MPRWAAILLLYLGGLGLVAVVLAIMLPPLIAQGRELAARVPGYLEMAEAELAALGLLGGDLTWRDIFERVQGAGAGISGALGAGLSGVFGAVQNVLGAIGAIVTVLLLPFYLLVEAESLQAGLLKLFPPERRPAVARVTRDVTIKVGGWLGGQLLLAIVIGSTATLGLWLIGVPYFYVLGLVAAIGEMIPVVGPLLAAVPAVLVGWTESTTIALVVAGFFAAQQFVENNVLVPRIMQSQVGVSAVTVLVALLVGSALLGVVGALLAVPSAAIAQVLFHEFIARDDAVKRRKRA
jgi:predicted PurR-regulated permease PerM